MLLFSIKLFVSIFVLRRQQFQQLTVTAVMVSDPELVLLQRSAEPIIQADGIALRHLGAMRKDVEAALASLVEALRRVHRAQARRLDEYDMW